MSNKIKKNILHFPMISSKEIPYFPVPLLTDREQYLVYLNKVKQQLKDMKIIYVHIHTNLVYIFETKELFPKLEETLIFLDNTMEYIEKIRKDSIKVMQEKEKELFDLENLTDYFPQAIKKAVGIAKELSSQGNYDPHTENLIDLQIKELNNAIEKNKKNIESAKLILWAHKEIVREITEFLEERQIYEEYFRIRVDILDPTYLFDYMLSKEVSKDLHSIKNFWKKSLWEKVKEIWKILKNSLKKKRHGIFFYFCCVFIFTWTLPFLRHILETYIFSDLYEILKKIKKL